MNLTKASVISEAEPSIEKNASTRLSSGQTCGIFSQLVAPGVIRKPAEQTRGNKSVSSIPP